MQQPLFLESTAEPPTPPPPLARRRRRAPLGPRKRATRVLARARIAAGTRVDLLAAQRARDPLPPLSTSRNGAVRAAKVLLALLAAAAVHAAVVFGGRLVGGSEVGRREAVRQEVKIEVQERKVERKVEPPPPPPEEKPPAPEKRIVKPPPKVAKAEPPPRQAPPPTPTDPPPRVVGLSLESTVEGSGGPAFAVGTTREGHTAERAVAPRVVVPAASIAAPATPAETSNRAASRIPVAGVKYTPPKRKRPSTPPYPELLKSQGIETDVAVLVAIAASGGVTGVKIVRPSPYPEFNEAARKAALAEEYEPATRDGVAIAYTVNFVYRFRLENQ